jgi:hypothetical protein
MNFVTRNFLSKNPAQSAASDLENQSLISSNHGDYGSTAHLGEVEIVEQPIPATPSSTRTPAYHYQIPNVASIAGALTTTVSEASAIAASSLGPFHEHVVIPAPTSLERAQETLQASARHVVEQAQNVHQYLNDREAEKMIAPYRAIDVNDLDAFSQQLWASNPGLRLGAEDAPLVFNSQGEVVPLAPPLHHLTPAEHEAVRVDFRKALVAFYGENLVQEYEAPQEASSTAEARPACPILSNGVLTIGIASSILMELNDAAEALQATNASSLPPACRVMQREAEQRVSGTLSPEVAQIG